MGKKIITFLTACAIFISCSFFTIFLEANKAKAADEPVDVSLGLAASNYTASTQSDSAVNAFDGSSGTNWGASPGAQKASTPQWLKVDFGETRSFSRVDIHQWSDRIKRFRIQYSADGATWNTAFSGYISAASNVASATNKKIVFPQVSGRYFRFVFTETFNAGSGQTQPTIYSMNIFDIAGDAVTSPDIAAGLNFEENTNIALGLLDEAYTASSSNTGSGQTPEKAFNNDVGGTPWQNATATYPAWIQMDFSEKMTFDYITIQQYNKRISNFSILISDNGSTWTTAYTGTVSDASDTGGTHATSIKLPELLTARYLRFRIDDACKNASQQPFTIIIYEMCIYKNSTGVSSGTVTLEAAPKNLTAGLQVSAFTASNSATNQTADKAFDGNGGSVWQVPANIQSPTAPQWIQVNFGEVKSFSRVDFTQYRNRAKQFKLQVSNNGTDWTDAFAGNIPSASDASSAPNASYTVVFPQVSGQYFRMLFLETAYYNDNPDSAVKYSAPAIFEMSVYDKPGAALTSEAVKPGLIVYDNLALGKEAGAYTASSSNPTEAAEKAFDGSAGTNWQNVLGSALPAWLQVDLGEKTLINTFVLKQWSNRIKSFRIMVSDDGIDWTRVYFGRITNAANSSGATELVIVFPETEAKYVKLFIDDTIWSANAYLTIPVYEMELYYRPDFTTSSNIVEADKEAATAETLALLESTLTRVEKLDGKLYTEKTYAPLKALIDEARQYIDEGGGYELLLLNLISEIELAEDALVVSSDSDQLKKQISSIIKMNEKDYNPTDWNDLMLLVQSASAVLAQENPNQDDVDFYVKSIDIMLAAMRDADEEELTYEYLVNPAREGDFLATLITDGEAEIDDDIENVSTGDVEIGIIIAGIFAAAFVIIISGRAKKRDKSSSII